MGLCWLLVKTRKPARFKVAPGRVRVLNAFPGSGRVPGTRRALTIYIGARGDWRRDKLTPESAAGWPKRYGGFKGQDRTGLFSVTTG
jgi:hypothetical protein